MASNYSSRHGVATGLKYPAKIGLRDEQKTERFAARHSEFKFDRVGRKIELKQRVAEWREKLLGATISLKHSEISLVILGKFETNLKMYTYIHSCSEVWSDILLSNEINLFFLKDANIVITNTINYVDIRN